MTKLVKIDDDVRDVLVHATMTATTVVLPELCERGLYTRVDKVLKAAGGKWNRKARAHVFDGLDPRTMLADVATAPAVVNRRQDLQQFPTPAVIAQRLVAIADVRHPHDCMEPSAGRGAIADAMRRVGVGQPLLVEIDEPCVEELQAKGYTRILPIDFLTIAPPQDTDPGGGFDRIVMNPPFRNGQDIAHVTHAFRMLRDGGVLVAVVSPSIEFRSTKTHEAFRELLREHGSVVERLPRGTFDDAAVETLVVRLVR